MNRNLIEELGSLALATRLKNLGERLAKDVAAIYKEQDVDFEPRWFAMIQALKESKKALAVTELSGMLQQTHPAIHQVANVLVKHGLVVEFSDQADQRKRLFRLSKKGESLVKRLEGLWQKIKNANDQLLAETGTDFLSLIKTLENSLHEKSMYERIRSQLK